MSQFPAGVTGSIEKAGAEVHLCLGLTPELAADLPDISESRVAKLRRKGLIEDSEEDGWYIDQLSLLKYAGAHSHLRTLRKAMGSPSELIDFLDDAEKMRSRTT